MTDWKQLDCDAYWAICLPRPCAHEGSLVSMLAAIKVISELNEDDRKRMDVLPGTQELVKCMRWDAMRQRGVYWTRTEVLEAGNSCSEVQLNASGYDARRLAISHALENMPQPDSDADLQEVHRSTDRWELDTLQILRDWNIHQRLVFLKFKEKGHPLLYEGLATGEVHFPQGIAWMSGDQENCVRIDSWRSELHLGYLLRALILLRRGLRIGGRTLFFDPRGAVYESGIETYAFASSLYDNPSQEFRGKWTVRLEQAMEAFAEADAVLSDLRYLQRGWECVNTGGDNSSIIFELRPRYASGIQNLCKSLFQRCGYLRKELWGVAVRATVSYRQGRQSSPASIVKDIQNAASEKSPAPKAPSQSSSSSSSGGIGIEDPMSSESILKMFSSNSAMDKEFWAQLQDSETNLRSTACMALAEECSGAAAFELKKSYLPLQCGAPLIQLANSLRCLHRGALLFHLAHIMISEPDTGTRMLANGLVSDDVFAILSKITVTGESLRLCREVEEVASGGRPRNSLGGDDDEEDHTAQLLSTSDFSMEVGIRAYHLALFHLTSAMKDCMVRGQPVCTWQECMRREIMELYVRECSRLERQYVAHLTRRRERTMTEIERLKFGATLGYGVFWANLQRGCVLPEVLAKHTGGGAVVPSDRCLCLYPEIMDKFLAVPSDQAVAYTEAANARQV